MGRHVRASFLPLLGWALGLWLGMLFATAPVSPLAAAQTGVSGRPRLATARTGFDRAAIEAELSRGAPAQSSEALQERVRRLTEVYGSLGLADLPEAERKAFGDRILGQIVQAELLLRGQRPEAREPQNASVRAAGESWTEILRDTSGFLLAALAAVVVCFALGNLVGYRRGARQASYYGEGDPRIRFLSRPPSGPEHGDGRPMTLEEIRRRLREGQPVLLQLGYEIDPKERIRFLAALTETRRALGDVEGLRFAAWEDPRHPSRFYECLECRRLWAVDRLTDLNGPLSRLAAEIEACRPVDGWIVRRAWWGALRDREEAGQQPGASGVGA